MGKGDVLSGCDLRQHLCCQLHDMVLQRGLLEMNDTGPSTQSPRGLADLYKIQLRDLIAMQMMTAMKTQDPKALQGTTEDILCDIGHAYRLADLALEVRLEPPVDDKKEPCEFSPKCPECGERWSH